MSDNAAADDAAKHAIESRILRKNIHWYVLVYTLITPNQRLFPEQIFSNANTETRYFKKSECVKDVTTKTVWNFE